MCQGVKPPFEAVIGILPQLLGCKNRGIHPCRCGSGAVGHKYLLRVPRFSSKPDGAVTRYAEQFGVVALNQQVTVDGKGVFGVSEYLHVPQGDPLGNGGAAGEFQTVGGGVVGGRIGAERQVSVGVEEPHKRGRPLLVVVPATDAAVGRKDRAFVDVEHDIVTLADAVRTGRAQGFVRPGRNQASDKASVADRRGGLVAGISAVPGAAAVGMGRVPGTVTIGGAELVIGADRQRSGEPAAVTRWGGEQVVYLGAFDDSGVLGQEIPGQGHAASGGHAGVDFFCAGGDVTGLHDRNHHAGGQEHGEHGFKQQKAALVGQARRSAGALTRGAACQ